MARACSVCSHVERDQIDRAIVSGSGVVDTALSLRRLAVLHGLTEASVRRHRRHVGLALERAKAAPTKAEKSERERGQTLIARARGLDAGLVEAVQLAKEQGDPKAIVAAIRGRRELIETEAKLELLANPMGSGPFSQQAEPGDEFAIVRVRGRADLIGDDAPLADTGRPRRVGTRAIDVAAVSVEERRALPSGPIVDEPADTTDEDEFRARLRALDSGRAVDPDEDDEDEALDELEPDVRGKVRVPPGSTLVILEGGH
jgi:hypothetical protein